jgi:hypothetical protein
MTNRPPIYRSSPKWKKRERKEIESCGMVNRNKRNLKMFER